VRIGERLVAVSMGDGGVRALVELDTPGAAATTAPVLTVSAPPRRSATLPAASAPAAAVVANALPADFRNLLRTALRSSTTLALLAALLLPAVASAQGAPSAAQMEQAIKQATGMVGGGAGAGAKAAPGGNAAASQKGAADQLSALVNKATQGTRGGKNANAKGAALSADNEGDDPIESATPSIDLRVGGGGAGGDSGLRLSGTVGVVVMMGLLTLLPTLVLMMTGFTRILVVLHFLRQAIGTQSAPPAQLIAALALLITGFVMSPTLSEVNRTALQPWMDGKMEQGQMLTEGVKPFRTFMLRQVRPSDLSTFAGLSGQPVAGGPQDAPLVVLVAAFVTSELRTAFQIGFALFLPFIVIDVVVASVLMSMGMMMLPPAMISLPFKLLLFVLVDGWALIVTGLVQSFH
jgi:flagellar biosynthetic protein FliP